MKLEIVLYGITKDIFEKNKIQLDCSAPIKVSEVKEMLLQHIHDNYDAQKARELMHIAAVAVNNEIIAPNFTLFEDAQLSLLPPVSGG